MCLTLWHIRLNISVWKTKFSSLKQYMFDLLFSRYAKKTHTDQSILRSFLLCLKISVSQTFKSSSYKSAFCKCAHQWYNLLRWMLFLQKQPFRGVLIKKCSEGMQQIYRRTPMPKCDLNKVAKQLLAKHVTKHLWMAGFVYSMW